MRDVFPGLIFLFDLNVHVYLKMGVNYEIPESRKRQKLIFLIKIKHNIKSSNTTHNIFRYNMLRLTKFPSLGCTHKNIKSKIYSCSFF